jgi:RNA polymerase sigma-70 factor (ECF subfamily)
MDRMIETLERELLDRRAAMLGFIRGKVGDDELAEDILQDSLLRALQSGRELQDEHKLVSWLYQIIRNAITDAYRRRAAAERRLEQYALEHMDEVASDEDRAALCKCLRALLPGMNPDYAELIEAMDLENEDSGSVAERLEITRSNLKVRHHRARRQLRQRLEETCRTCARHGCIDCTCRTKEEIREV